MYLHTLLLYGVKNVHQLLLQGDRWSVIMLPMIQAEQTSHLSPYCNEPVFRNSNYLFDCLTNDKNRGAPVHIHTLSYTQTKTCTHTFQDNAGVGLTFNGDLTLSHHHWFSPQIRIHYEHHPQTQLCLRCKCARNKDASWVYLQKTYSAGGGETGWCQTGILSKHDSCSGYWTDVTDPCADAGSTVWWFYRHSVLTPGKLFAKDV